MEWRVGMYGSLNPPRSRVIVVNSLLGSMLFAGYGFWTDFLPSPLVDKFGTYLAIAISLALGGYTAHGYSTGRFAWFKRPGWIARKACYAAITIGIYCMAWLILVRAAPDVVTRVFGTDGSTTLLLDSSYDHRRKSCDFQLRGPELGFPWHICLPLSHPGHFAAHGDVLFSGKSTALGLHVSHIEPIAVLNAK